MNQAGQPEWAVRVLASNAGPMTLTGTNTWILAAPGAPECVVVDPGPADLAHLDAVTGAVAGRKVAGVLLTHGHHDHVDGVPALLARSGSRVLDVRDGEVLELAGLSIDVVATPGHTRDSTCFRARDALLTGDTILGTGTSVIAWPDGDLGDYLESLRRLATLIDRRHLSVLLPGHGPIVGEPASVVAEYLAHRLERIDQVRAAVSARSVDRSDHAEAVVDVVYPGSTGALRPAALATVRATLDYLDRH